MKDQKRNNDDPYNILIDSHHVPHGMVSITLFSGRGAPYHIPFTPLPLVVHVYDYIGVWLWFWIAPVVWTLPYLGIDYFLTLAHFPLPNYPT